MQSMQIPGLSLGIPGIPGIPGITYHSPGDGASENAAYFEPPPDPALSTASHSVVHQGENASAFHRNVYQSAGSDEIDHVSQPTPDDREDDDREEGELSDTRMQTDSSESSIAGNGRKRKASDTLAGPPASRVNTGAADASELSIRGAAQFRNHEKRALLVLTALLREFHDPDTLLRRLALMTYRIRDSTIGVDPVSYPAAAAVLPVQKPNGSSTLVDHSPTPPTTSRKPVGEHDAKKPAPAKAPPQDRAAYLARLNDLKNKKPTAPIPNPAKRPNIPQPLPAMAERTIMPLRTPKADVPATPPPKFTPRPDMNTVLAKKLAALRAERAEKLAAEKLAAEKLSADIDQLIDSAPRSASDSKPSTPSAPSVSTPPLPNHGTRKRLTAADLNESDMDLRSGTQSDSNRPSTLGHASASRDRYESVVIEASSSEDEPDGEEAQNVDDMERVIEKIKAEIRAREQRRQRQTPAVAPSTTNPADESPAPTNQSSNELVAVVDVGPHDSLTGTIATVEPGLEVPAIGDSATTSFPPENENEAATSQDDSDASSSEAVVLEDEDMAMDISDDSSSVSDASSEDSVASSEDDIPRPAVKVNNEVSQKDDLSGSDDSSSDDSDAMDISSDEASESEASEPQVENGVSHTDADTSSDSQEETAEAPTSTVLQEPAQASSEDDSDEDEDEYEYEPESVVERDPSMSPLEPGSPPRDWQRPAAAFQSSSNVIVHHESGDSNVNQSTRHKPKTTIAVQPFVPYQPLRRAANHEMRLP